MNPQKEPVLTQSLRDMIGVEQKFIQDSASLTELLGEGLKELQLHPDEPTRVSYRNDVYSLLFGCQEPVYVSVWIRPTSRFVHVNCFSTYEAVSSKMVCEKLEEIFEPTISYPIDRQMPTDPSYVLLRPKLRQS